MLLKKFYLIFLLGILFPVSLFANEKVVDISAGVKSFCALTSNNKISCWGDSAYSGTKKLEKLKLKQLLAINGCAVTVDNRIFCDNDELGRIPPNNLVVKNFYEKKDKLCVVTEKNDIRCFFKAKNPRTPLKGKAVSIGSGFFCSITMDDKLFCWGNRDYDHANSANMFLDVKLKNISSTETETCGITQDDTIICWKAGYIEISIPQEYEKERVRWVGSAPKYGEFHCAIKLNNEVFCWGNNQHGQLEIPENLKAKSIALGRFGVCANNLNDKVICWGQKERAQADVPKGFVKKKLDSNSNYFCGIDQDDFVKCWGNNFDGPVKTPKDLKAKEVAVNSFQACAIKEDNSVHCWGRNYEKNSPQWKELSYMLQQTKAKKLYVNNDQSCALTLNDKIVCWSDPAHYQPFYPSNFKFKQVSVTSSYSCGIDSQDNLLCWYSRKSSIPRKPTFKIPQEISIPAVNPEKKKEVAVKTTASKPSINPPENLSFFDKVKLLFKKEKSTQPAKVAKAVSPFQEIVEKRREDMLKKQHVFLQASSMKAKKVVAKKGNSCVITPDDHVSCWGEYKAEPSKQIKFKDIFLTAYAFCGKTFEDKMICWGKYSRKQKEALPPADLKLKAFSIAESAQAGCGIKLDNTVTCWGSNRNGIQNVPKGLKAKEIFSTLRAVCAVTMDDSLSCWGHLPNLPPAMAGVPKKIRQEKLSRR